jgi:hypothetical protein
VFSFSDGGHPGAGAMNEASAKKLAFSLGYSVFLVVCAGWDLISFAVLYFMMIPQAMGEGDTVAVSVFQLVGFVHIVTALGNLLVSFLRFRGEPVAYASTWAVSVWNAVYLGPIGLIGSLVWIMSIRRRERVQMK